MAWRPIPAEALNPARLRVILPRLGVHRDSPAFLVHVASLVAATRPAPHATDELLVGPNHAVVYEPLRAALPGATRVVGRSDPAAVRAAVAVALAWQRGELEDAMELPLWELGLREVLSELRLPERPEAAATGHTGWIRYVVRVPTELPYGWPADGLRVERWIVRRSRRGDGLLKPLRCPDDLMAIEARITPVTPVDRRLHAVLAELELVAPRVGRFDQDADRARFATLTRQAMALLSEVHEVWLSDRPVRVAAEPLPVSIRAAPGPDGLVLGWRPEIVQVWAGPAPLALTADGVLGVLPHGFTARGATLLTRPLPTVPQADLGRFIARVVATAPIPIEVPDLEATLVSPDARRVRVRLEEIGSDLQVVAELAYRSGEVEVAAAPGATGLLRLPDGRFLRPDPAWEADAVAMVTDLTGELPRWLRGDDAWAFLADVVPALRELVDVEVDAALLKRRYVGTAVPSVSLASDDLDWFDLAVTVSADGKKLPLGPVLAAHAEGRRFVALDDGRVARLPEAWLSRHADDLARLAEARRATGGRLGGHVAWLVRPLLDEVPDAGRWRDVADRLDAFHGVTARPAPEGLVATLRSYQATGWSWLAALRDLGLGACLADDMGLGKTVQTLALLLDTHGSEGPPSLVVAPTSVVPGWLREAQRFAPSLRVVLHHGPDRGESFDDVDVVITTYALVRRDVDLLASVPWRVVVLDEAQAIKNPDSAVARACRMLPAGFRVALTGTPLENHLGELWSLFRFLLPGLLGSRGAFAERYRRPVDRGDVSALSALRERLRPFVLRRLKSEVEAELPDRDEVVRWCELGPEQRALYEMVRDTFRASVLEKVAATGVRRASLHVLEALTRLRQACCDPSLLPFPEAAGVTGSAKLDLLEEVLHEIVDSGHRALVFSQWPSLLALAAARCAARGWAWLYLDGGTRDRQAVVDRWNHPGGPPLFLISLKAGGTGLNLTAADRVVHLDPWWNPAVEAQATDRAHRIGQTRRVISIKLVARDTVEEKILELQARKRALFEAAIDAERLVASELTRADLEAVFGEPPSARYEAPPPPRPQRPHRVALPAPVHQALHAAGHVTVAEVAALLGVSPAVARRTVQAMVRHGLLRAEGGPGRYVAAD